jgi:TatD family-associated radical SAM protein
LDSEPDIAAVKDALNAYPLDDYAEIVFCGYGEPTEALPVLLDTARYLKTKNKTVRLNTNGLGDLINGKHIAPLLSGLIDIVSISLNTSDAAKYNDLCKPVFGVGAYQAMLDFARECKDNIPQTRFTIVDTIGADEIEKCRAVAETVGIPLNVRAKI